MTGQLWPVVPWAEYFGPLVLRWLLFFAMSLGLGYAAFTRYDPRELPGLTDTSVYTRLVSGDPVEGRSLRFRILVPYVAKPFYWLLQGRMSSDRTALLALLFANSIFCATSATLLVDTGVRLGIDLATSLLGALLYLSSFAIPNLQLAGLVDSGESFWLLAVTWSLCFGRLWQLPVWGVLGALAKETFVPLVTFCAIGWLLKEWQQRRGSVRQTLAIVIMVAAALSTALLMRSFSSSPGGWYADAEILKPGLGFLHRLWDGIFSREFVYIFGWLLPLGLWRLRDLPRPWVWAVALGILPAVALSAYKGVGGNMARPVFNVAGPLLSLSAALLLTGQTFSVRAQAGVPPDR